MLFSSPIFLFLFLPIVIAGYWLAGKRGRNLFLLGGSLFFYTWGEGRYVYVLVASIVANYSFGVLIARYRDGWRGRLLIITTLLFNLGVLVWYKYSVFLVTSSINPILTSLKLSPLVVQTPHLPLGVSFFTFQAIAYVLDVYRETVSHPKSLFRFALFMSLFPKLAAGPIIRYDEVANDLDGRTPSSELFAAGVERFIVGIGKKVLIADSLAKVAEQVFVIPVHDLTAGVAWLGIVCYTLQLYFDFSGYSDMAIGLGRMFGFTFQENFNYPYVARSLTEFWRRWHISLSSWFRDYLFTPLSYALMTDRIRQKIARGEYRTNYRIAYSIVVVFTLCGLWHGASWNFVVWGLLHGLVLAIESIWLGKSLKRWWRPFQHMYLILVVMLAWVFFRVQVFSDALMFLKALAGFSGSSGRQFHVSLYVDNVVLLALVAGILGAVPIVSVCKEWITTTAMRRFVPALKLASLVLILVGAAASSASSTFTPFIYQKF